MAAAQEPVDLDMVSRIRQEAFHRSQVMATFSHLTESIGPRLTNSPQMAQANAWTRGKFSEWGLANVHDEAFDDFGRGWGFSDASAAAACVAQGVDARHQRPGRGRGDGGHHQEARRPG